MGVRLVSVIIAAVMSAAFAVPVQAAEPAKTTAPKAAPAPAPIKHGDPASPECAWIGKRIIQLLSRDDVVAAGEFREFYDGFGCSESHLGAAFGCAIDGASQGAADACAARSDCVDVCWASPTASPLEKPAPVAAPQAPATKSQGNAPAPAKAAPAPAAPAPAAPAPAAPPKKPSESPTLQPRGPYDAKP